MFIIRTENSLAVFPKFQAHRKMMDNIPVMFGLLDLAHMVPEDLLKNT